MSDFTILNPRAHAKFLEELGSMDALMNGRQVPARRPATRRNPGINLGPTSGRFIGNLGPHPDIIKLREYLIRIMPTHPAVKVLDPVLNTWDDSLKAAVIAFQGANGLTADGLVGSGTWGKLDALIVGKPTIDEVLAQTRPPELRTQNQASDVVKGLTNLFTSVTSFFPTAVAAEQQAAAAPVTTAGGTLPAGGEEKPDNTLLYVGLGVGGLVILGTIVILATRK